MYFMNSKVVLAIFYETASDSYKITLNTFHHITSWVLIFDTFVKILAYGWVRYISTQMYKMIRSILATTRALCQCGFVDRLCS